MKIKGLIGSMMSGSTGGLTASHNRGGYYFRNRSVPTNPSSDRQKLVRSALSELTSRWSAVLTSTQRADWDTYAFNTPINNALGDPVNVGGKGMYLRCNVPRRYANLAIGTSLSIEDNGPTVFGLPGAIAEALSIDSATDEVEVSFDNTAGWATSVKGALLVYTSRPLAAGINYFTGPYQLGGAVEGAAIAPTSPEDVAAAFPFAAAGRIAIRLVATFPDARLSADLWTGILTA